MGTKRERQSFDTAREREKERERESKDGEQVISYSHKRTKSWWISKNKSNKQIQNCLAATTLGLGGHRLDVDDRVRLVTAIARESRVGPQGLLDLMGHGHETLLDVGGILGRGLEELERRSLGELLGRLEGDGTLGVQIALVSDQQLGHALARIPVDLLQPLLDVVERNLVGDVVHDDDPVRASVVRTGDGAEPLLPRSIPDLQLDGLAVVLDRADLEVDPDRRDVALRVRVVRKTEQQTALPNARVSNQEKLPQVVTEVKKSE